MNKYYKVGDIYFKLDDAMTFFEHVTNTAVEKTIIHSMHLGNVQKLHQAKTGPAWEEVTQQEFETVRTGVLLYLSV